MFFFPQSATNASHVSPTKLPVAFAALLMIIGAACSRTLPHRKACLQFSSDLMPDLAGGLSEKIFRVANAGR